MISSARHCTSDTGVDNRAVEKINLLQGRRKPSARLHNYHVQLMLGTSNPRLIVAIIRVLLSQGILGSGSSSNGRVGGDRLLREYIRSDDSVWGCSPGPSASYLERNNTQMTPGGEPTKVRCNYIWANVITFVQMQLHSQNCDPLSWRGKCNHIQM